MEPLTVALRILGAHSETVWAGAQTPSAVQKALPWPLGCNRNKTRVIVPFVGGGFAGKASVKIEPLAAAASQKLRQGCSCCSIPIGIDAHLPERLRADTNDSDGWGPKRTDPLERCQNIADGGAYSDTGSAVASKSAYRIYRPVLGSSICDSRRLRSIRTPFLVQHSA